MTQLDVLTPLLIAVIATPVPLTTVILNLVVKLYKLTALITTNVPRNLAIK
jgi:hypothetical protein